MKIESLEDNNKVFRFALKGATNGYANALRRVATNHVKCFAIDTVTFYENSSAMFDEYVAHRIGLIPISTPSSGYSEDDAILFTLDAEGPKVVYSKELEGKDKEVKVANENIPIIKLASEQRLRIDCKAILGNGARHSKFQPGLITYDQEDESTFNFYVETFGQMPPKEIINKAFSAIKEELKEIEKEVKKI
ncbi:MAG: DNA-directed RNA polymerase subunit D [Candidatus Micrarchaeota archaeon]|nr:DNA-directed RNA polymerase subunit D [Candidatus Micrarchaeota archaeon]